MKPFRSIAGVLTVALLSTAYGAADAYAADDLLTHRINCVLSETADEGIADCKWVNQRKPDDLAIVLKLGELLEKSNQLHEAVALYQTYGRRFPRDKRFQRRLVIARSNLEELQSGQKYQVDKRKINSKLAVIKCKTAPPAKIRPLCSAVLQIDPDNAIARQRLAQLEKDRRPPIAAAGSNKTIVNKPQAAPIVKKTQTSVAKASQAKAPSQGKSPDQKKRPGSGKSVATAEPSGKAKTQPQTKKLAKAPAKPTGSGADAESGVNLDAIKCITRQGVDGLAACRTALKLFPRSAKLHSRQGQLLMNEGKYDQALKSFKSALKLEPNNQTLAKVVKELGDNLGSIDSYQLAGMELDVTSAKPETVEQKLAVLDSLRGKKLISDQDYHTKKNQILDHAFSDEDSLGKVGRQQTDTKLTRKALRERFALHSNYALIIGNNNYRHVTTLETAVNDARALARLLEEQYGYQTELMIDATRYDILKAVARFRKKLKDEDNFLIYYAGHGYLDKQIGRGYWLPVDAEKDVSANWISTIDITDSIKAMRAKHVMVVADSCYSGTLTRNVNIEAERRSRDLAVLERLAFKRSRTVLTSGGLEPVLDNGTDGHSVFAAALISVLKENTGIVEGSKLFSELRKLVVVNADQTPQYSNIRGAGHQGGDYIFIRL